MNALPARQTQPRARYGGTGKIKPWRCTASDAIYCPLHGDCTCDVLRPPSWAADCPLHGKTTTHPTAVEMVA